MTAIQGSKLYINLKKCHFMVDYVLFLGYMINKKGVQVGKQKIQAIVDWPIPNSISEVCNFHGLATFYRYFLCNFSNIVALIMDSLKQSRPFKWTLIETQDFEEIKQKLTSAPILTLPNFDKVFQVECDACGTRVGDVLAQEICPIAFLSGKLNDAPYSWPTYDQELFVIFCAFKN